MLTPLTVLTDVRDKDPLIAFSLRRYRRETTKLGELFHAAGGKLVLVTDSDDAPLAPLADALIRVPYRQRVVRRLAHRDGRRLSPAQRPDHRERQGARRRLTIRDELATAPRPVPARHPWPEQQGDTSMRIERLRIFEVRLHLVHSFQTSSHRKSGLTHLLVAATDTDGRTGWGEIASRPTRSTVRKPRVPGIRDRHRLPGSARLDSDWDTPPGIEASWAKIRGHEFTKAGFSGAAWGSARPHRR